MNLRRTVFLICAFLLLILFTSGVAALYSFYGKKPAPIEKEDTDESKNGKNSIEYPEILEARTYSSPANLLVLGVDEDGLRSDVMMLVNYDPGENIVNVLSIARDTRIYVDGKPQKINALIGMGGEILTIQAVEKLTGIRPDYYLTLNFRGFREIIDVLGGVEVDVPLPMHYDDASQNLHIHLEKGRQLLDGKKAEQFIRYRKGNSAAQGYADGDLGRIRAQQTLIRELVAQKLKLRYLSKIDDIYSIVKKYVKTNVTLSDIYKYLDGVKDIKPENIKFFTNPGTPRIIDGISYYICDVSGTREIIKNHFKK